MDINNLTPVEALNKLNDIKRIFKGKWVGDKLSPTVWYIRTT
jgi:hypothetical protein